MSKNIFIAILALTTIYLGWLSFAHAATFSTKKDSTALSISYDQCDTITTKTETIAAIKDKDEEGAFIISKGDLLCDSNKVATGVSISTETEVGSDKLTAVYFTVKCCRGTVTGLYH